MKDETVKQFIFGMCSEGILEELSSGGDYWQSCSDFIYDNLDRKLGDLSPKQRNWLIKIKDGLLEEAAK